ncbi:Uncharacterized conserved protein, contains NRDE domain [Arboricoccus pini]|uniref:Uncharacterized conserved protein, contains NRDE domain n=1 Tax=Arboricoccus pini TaxID=1963835 RepID=A0A212RTX5_9PROT|nr:NRDE family protein [Arboricoccus pini]SNB76073.1 Uncharacterized conserved protein, contains NRDE domain [Arboricoccus pini]
MCSVVILRRPDRPWPLILAANRDELWSRASRPPARHWDDRPELVAGLDEEAGGSWLGINDWGVLASVLNREGTLGPTAGKRSRGELVLDALDHADAKAAAEALRHVDGSAFRPFNLIIADNRDAFWLRHEIEGDHVTVVPVPAGLSMIASRDLNDPNTPRIARYRHLFEQSTVPDPDKGPTGDWSDWELLLGARAGKGQDPRAAMCVVTEGDYGTVSSSFIALPADIGRRPVWLHAEGRPGETPFYPVALD